jgi:precorrin-4/cobalt-precorrin-4 C11-methyltransferase
LSDIREKTRAAKLTRTALVLVGHVLDSDEATDSRLYAPDHRHILRPQG